MLRIYDQHTLLLLLLSDYILKYLLLLSCLRSAKHRVVPTLQRWRADACIGTLSRMLFGCGFTYVDLANNENGMHYYIFNHPSLCFPVSYLKKKKKQSKTENLPRQALGMTKLDPTGLFFCVGCFRFSYADMYYES